MAKFRWAVLCAKTIIDQRTNLVSAIELLDEIQVQIPEGFFNENKDLRLNFHHEIIISWQRVDSEKPDSYEMRMEITGEPVEGVVLKPILATVPLDTANRNRNIIVSEGLNVTKAGTIWFLISVQRNKVWEEVGRIPLEISIEYK